MNDLLKRAESFARIRHMGQFRKGKAQDPYIIHLDEVAELVTSWNGTENAKAAAWLHDTVEDCPPPSYEAILAMDQRPSMHLHLTWPSQMILLTSQNKLGNSQKIVTQVK